MDKILKELKHHIPFTAFGAMTGMVFMFLFRKMGHETAHHLFYFFHPLHVVLSAVVTAAIFKRYKSATTKDGKCSFWEVLLIGYVGSIGIATLSDSLIPYSGEYLLKLPNLGMHIGFIDQWWLVNPAAIIGVIIGYYWPHTKFPHAGHVLLSTWASLFHVIMAMGAGITLGIYAGIFVFLFLSVWLPCCVSDIAFPLLFVKNGKPQEPYACCKH